MKIYVLVWESRNCNPSHRGEGVRLNYRGVTHWRKGVLLDFYGVTHKGKDTLKKRVLLDSYGVSHKGKDTLFSVHTQAYWCKKCQNNQKSSLIELAII